MRTQSTQTEPLNLGTSPSFTSSPFEFINLNSQQQRRHHHLHDHGHLYQPQSQHQLMSTSATFLASTGSGSCCPASIVHEVDHSIFFDEAANTAVRQQRSRRPSAKSARDDDETILQGEFPLSDNAFEETGGGESNRDPRTPSYPSYASGGHLHQHQFVIRTIPAYLTLSPRASYHRLNIKKNRYPTVATNRNITQIKGDEGDKGDEKDDDKNGGGDPYAELTGDTIMLCCFPDDLLYDRFPNYLKSGGSHDDGSNTLTPTYSGRKEGPGNLNIDVPDVIMLSGSDNDNDDLCPPTPPMRSKSYKSRKRLKTDPDPALKYAENLSWAILKDLEEQGKQGEQTRYIKNTQKYLPPPKTHLYKSSSEHGILELTSETLTVGQPNELLIRGGTYLEPPRVYGNGSSQTCGSSTRATYSGSSAEGGATCSDSSNSSSNSSKTGSSSSYGLPPPPPPLHNTEHLYLHQMTHPPPSTYDKQLQTTWTKSLEQMLDFGVPPPPPPPLPRSSLPSANYSFESDHQYHHHQLPVSTSSHHYSHHHQQTRPKSADVYGESVLPPPPFFHHPSFSESELYVQITKENYNSAQDFKNILSKELNRRHSAIADLAIVDGLNLKDLDGSGHCSLVEGVLPPPALPPLPLELAALQSVIATPPPGFEDEDEEEVVVDRFFAAAAASSKKSTTGSSVSSNNIVSPESELSTSQVTSVTNCSELLATTGTTFSSDVTGGTSTGGGVHVGIFSSGSGLNQLPLEGRDVRRSFPEVTVPTTVPAYRQSSSSSSSVQKLQQQFSSTTSDPVSSITSGGRFIGGRYTLDFDDDDGDEDENVEGDEEGDDREEDIDEGEGEGDDVYEELDDDDEFDDGCRLGPVNRIRIHPQRQTGKISRGGPQRMKKWTLQNQQTQKLQTSATSGEGHSAEYAQNVADYAVAEGSSQDEEEKAKYENEFETEEEEFGVLDEEELQLDREKNESENQMPPKRPSDLELSSQRLSTSGQPETSSSTLLYYRTKPAHFPPSPPETLPIAPDPPFLSSSVTPTSTTGGRVSSKSLPENLYRSAEEEEERLGRHHHHHYYDHDRHPHHHHHHYQGDGKGDHKGHGHHSRGNSLRKCDGHSFSGGRLTRAKSNTLGRLSGIRMTVPLSSNLSELFCLPGTKHLQGQFCPSDAFSDPRDLTPVLDSSVYSSDPSTTMELSNTSANTVVEREFRDLNDEEDADAIDGDDENEEVPVKGEEYKNEKEDVEAEKRRKKRSMQKSLLRSLVNRRQSTENESPELEFEGDAQLRPLSPLLSTKNSELEGKRDFSSEIFDRLKISPEKYHSPKVDKDFASSVIYPGPPSLTSNSDLDDHQQSTPVRRSQGTSGHRGRQAIRQRTLGRQDTFEDITTTTTTTTITGSEQKRDFFSLSRREDIPLLASFDASTVSQPPNSEGDNGSMLQGKRGDNGSDHRLQQLKSQEKRKNSDTEDGDDDVEDSEEEELHEGGQLHQRSSKKHLQVSGVTADNQKHHQHHHRHHHHHNHHNHHHNHHHHNHHPHGNREKDHHHHFPTSPSSPSTITSTSSNSSSDGSLSPEGALDSTTSGSFMLEDASDSMMLPFYTTSGTISGDSKGVALVDEVSEERSTSDYQHDRPLLQSGDDDQDCQVQTLKRAGKKTSSSENDKQNNSLGKVRFGEDSYQQASKQSRSMPTSRYDARNQPPAKTLVTNLDDIDPEEYLREKSDKKATSGQFDTPCSGELITPPKVTNFSGDERRVTQQQQFEPSIPTQFAPQTTISTPSTDNNNKDDYQPHYQQNQHHQQASTNHLHHQHQLQMNASNQQLQQLHLADMYEPCSEQATERDLERSEFSLQHQNSELDEDESLTFENLNNQSLSVIDEDDPSPVPVELLSSGGDNVDAKNVPEKTPEEDPEERLKLLKLKQTQAAVYLLDRFDSKELESERDLSLEAVLQEESKALERQVRAAQQAKAASAISTSGLRPLAFSRKDPKLLSDENSFEEHLPPYSEATRESSDDRVKKYRKTGDDEDSTSLSHPTLQEEEDEVVSPSAGFTFPSSHSGVINGEEEKDERTELRDERIALLGDSSEYTHSGVPVLSASPQKVSISSVPETLTKKGPQPPPVLTTVTTQHASAGKQHFGRKLAEIEARLIRATSFADQPSKTASGDLEEANLHSTDVKSEEKGDSPEVDDEEEEDSAAAAAAEELHLTVSHSAELAAVAALEEATSANNTLTFSTSCSHNGTITGSNTISECSSSLQTPGGGDLSSSGAQQHHHHHQPHPVPILKMRTTPRSHHHHHHRHSAGSAVVFADHPLEGGDQSLQQGQNQNLVGSNSTSSQGGENSASNCCARCYHRHHKQQQQLPSQTVHPHHHHHHHHHPQHVSGHQHYHHHHHQARSTAESTSSNNLLESRTPDCAIVEQARARSLTRSMVAGGGSEGAIPEVMSGVPLPTSRPAHSVRPTLARPSGDNTSEDASDPSRDQTPTNEPLPAGIFSTSNDKNQGHRRRASPCNQHYFTCSYCGESTMPPNQTPILTAFTGTSGPGGSGGRSSSRGRRTAGSGTGSGSKSTPPPLTTKSFTVEDVYFDVDDEENDIGVHTESYRSSTWIYIGRKEELSVWGTRNRIQHTSGSGSASRRNTLTESMATESTESSLQLSSSNGGHGVDNLSATSSHNRSESDESTVSEKCFRKNYEQITHRLIHRKASIELYRRILDRTFAIDKCLTLTRDNNEFGFRIHGSRPVVVSAVEKGTSADLKGLEVGDIIVSVNKVSVLDASHSDVVKLAAHKDSNRLNIEVASTAASFRSESFATGNNGSSTAGKSDFDSSGAPPPPSIIINGYLKRFLEKAAEVSGNSTDRMTNTKLWRRRWFVLKSDACLYWYRNPKCLEPIGAISLQGYCTGIVNECLYGQEHLFRLIGYGSRTPVKYFAATDHDTANQWVKALNQNALRFSNNNDGFIERTLQNIHRNPLSFPAPDCYGFLAKYNQLKKSWKQRYFVLKDACLYFYADANSNTALGLFYLHGYNVHTIPMTGRKHAFEISPPKSKFRNLWLCADSDADKKRWLAALEYSIDRWIQLH